MKIKLATGRELDCDYLGHSEQRKQATVRILNTPIAEVARLFSNPEQTVQLKFGNDYAAGFTKLLAVMDDGDAIRVVLGKE